MGCGRDGAQRGQEVAPLHADGRRVQRERQVAGVDLRERAPQRVQRRLRAQRLQPQHARISLGMCRAAACVRTNRHTTQRLVQDAAWRIRIDVDLQRMPTLTTAQNTVTCKSGLSRTASQEAAQHIVSPDSSPRADTPV